MPPGGVQTTGDGKAQQVFGKLEPRRDTPGSMSQPGLRLIQEYQWNLIQGLHGSQHVDAACMQTKKKRNQWSQASGDGDF